MSARSGGLRAEGGTGAVETAVGGSGGHAGLRGLARGLLFQFLVDTDDGGVDHADQRALGARRVARQGVSYLVYWDQNEEEDFLSMPSGIQGQLVPAWDPNGQMCLLPDGRFVVGYDPTLPSQDDLGSAKPYKQPADGEELDEPNGSFSGQTLYVPGPYKMPGQSIGSDSPPTPTGCSTTTRPTPAASSTRPATCSPTTSPPPRAQYPPPSSGRLVEWFAPSYTTYCIVYGPTAGGVGPAPHGRVGRPGPARDDGPGRQRRPARAQRRHFERAPLRRVVDAHRRLGMPGRHLPPQQGAGVDPS